MLAYFILGVSLLVALIIGSQSLATADPKNIVKALRISAVIICSLLAGFFVLTGQLQLTRHPLSLLRSFSSATSRYSAREGHRRGKNPTSRQTGCRQRLIMTMAKWMRRS